MVSDFLKKKYLHVFNSFFDVDHSGVVDKKDFDDSLAKAAKIRGWTTSDQEYNEAKETLYWIWELLQKKADSDNDGSVSKDEWVSVCSTVVSKCETCRKWNSLYAKFIFGLQDAGGDGSVDKDEYVEVLTAYGLSKDECEKAFAKMSKGKSAVSWEDFQELWKEYFLSDDVNAAGNFIFGKTSF